MGTAERKERDRYEMQQLILGTARKLFLKEGFENVSIRRIAEQIEYSPGSVYSYFKDKEEILFALHTEGFQKLLTKFHALDSIKDPLERFRKTGSAYVHFALENREYYDLMFIMSDTGKVIARDKEWSVGMEAYDYLRNLVRECMDKGLFPRGDVEVASFGIWSLVHGLVALVIRDRCPMIPEEQVVHMIENSLDYMFNTLVET